MAKAKRKTPTKKATEVTRFDAMPPEVTKLMDQSNEHVAVGDMFYYNRHEGRTEDVYRIVKLSHDKVFDRWEGDKKITKMQWNVYYQSATNFECTKWSDREAEELEDWLKKMADGTYVKMTKPFADTVAEAHKVIAGEISMDVYYQNEYAGSLNTENALIHKNSKESLQAIERVMTDKKRTAELIACAVGFQMEKKKRELEAIRENLYGAVAVFMKQVERIQRVILTIELYLGISEEITQIQVGMPADPKTPITFRQRVLFMDEEVGAHEDGGLDFRSLKEFDDWLLTGKNLDIVLPEKKGLVILCPRRDHKKYSDDPFLNVIMNIPNMQNTYFLIRNGDNVYRIYTDKLIVRDRLFPQRKELAALYKELSETDWEHEREEKKDRLEDTMYHYRKRAVLMQGLIDRTDIFKPMPVDRLNLFDLEGAQKLVNFVYDDDEFLLPDGRLRFKEWWKQCNESIQAGSRVLLTGKYGDGYSSYGYGRRSNREHPYADRFYLAANSDEGLKNVPDLPREGVYEVEEFTSSYSSHYRKTQYLKRLAELKAEGEHRFTDEGKVKDRSYKMTIDGDNSVYSIRVYEKKSNLTIMYKPTDQATAGWDSWKTHDRKVRTRFKIFKDDDFVINYDQMALDDIEFYIKNRTDRHNYLTMMPLLKELRKHLLAEMESEEAFKDLVFRRNAANMDHDDLELAIKESVNWWKFKNKWKRRISKDDTLALRMIEKRVLSPNYRKFTKIKTY